MRFEKDVAKAIANRARGDDVGLAGPLVGFFQWIARLARHGSHKNTLAVRSRGGSFHIPRESCGWHRLADDPSKKEAEASFRLSIEDPFET